MAKGYDKNYIKGSAKEIAFDNGGRLLNMSLLKEDLVNLPANDKGYVQITAAEKRETDQYGNTHSVYEDTYVPKEKKQGKPSPRKAAPQIEDDEDDLPF